MLKAVLLLLMISSCLANDVIELNDKNFDAIVKKSKFIVVEFYTNWCRHCANLKPIYEEVATRLVPHGIKLARVNTETATEVQEKYSINHFPYVVIFRNGQLYPYEGPGEKAGVPGLMEYFISEYNRPLEAKDHVIQLKRNNFRETVNEGDLTLVEFYAPWCGHCKKLEPIYSVVARQLKALAPDIVMARVDATMETELAKDYDITGYPTLMMFRKGRQYDYQGGRTEKEMLEYMLAQSGPSSRELSSKAEYLSFVNAPSARAVAFLSDKNSELLEAYIEAGQLIREDLQLAHCYDVSYDDAVTEVNSIIVYHPPHLVSPYEHAYTIITNASQFDEDEKSLADQILKATRPLVGEMSIQNSRRVYRLRPLLIAFYQVDWKEGLATTRYWHHMIAKVASEFQSEKLRFVIADEEVFRSDMAEFGFTDWGEDVAIGIYAGGPHKFRMEDEVTIETLREFVQGYLDQSLSVYIKSEPLGKSNLNSKALVKTLVGKNFEHVVFNPKMNVVVKLCYSQSEDCQNVQPKYESVAKRYKKTKKMMFTEMDVERNDPPLSIDITSFPTIYLSPSGSKEAVKMEQSFSTEQDLIQFIDSTIGSSRKHKDEL